MGFEIGVSDYPWEHKATGLTAHKHVLSLWRAKKDGSDSRAFCVL